MTREISGVVKNSMFAMVDLFLDYATSEDVNSQKDNISEFIIDCYNLELGDSEFELLQIKFEEEFENDSRFDDLEKNDILNLLEETVYSLVQDRGIPTLILNALNELNLQ